MAPPATTKVVLLCCRVDDLNAVLPLAARFKKLGGCPPVVALILRSKGAPFDTRLLAAASANLAQTRVDNVLVQPSEKLDLPDMLQAALAIVRQRWETEQMLNEEVDDRGNALFFNHIDELINGFPKLNAKMEERQPTRSTKGGIGRHDFVCALGEGKFGRVYKTGGVVGADIPEEAVKMIPKRCIKAPKHAHQILTECRMMQKVKHPNIAEFRGLVHGKRSLYIFMEFVGRHDLSAVIGASQFGRLASNEVSEHFLQISDAISFCHNHLVAHRDIKSENIVVSADSTPKLVDFGLAVQLSDPPRLCEDKCGTIPFAPPEVYRGEPFEATAMDVWSLGILMLEMRCGNNSVCKMLGCLEKAEPNEELASMVETFFSSPDWPLVVQRKFPGVGMAEELLVLLRASLVIKPNLRWSAADLYNHLASSSSHERVTGRTSEIDYVARTTGRPSLTCEHNLDRDDDMCMLKELQVVWKNRENAFY